MRRAPADLLGLGSRDLGGRRRIRLVMLAFSLIFLVIAGKLAYLSLVPRDAKLPAGAESQKMPRPDIVDRNGEVLARDIRVASLYAEPNKLIDIDEAVELLTANVPDLDARELRRKLSLDRSFIWLKRQVSPSDQQLIHDLGIPGIGFRDETLRVYPRGRLAAHVLGYVDVDSHGLAGIEKYLDGRGALFTASLSDPKSRTLEPVRLSIDSRIQHALADELQKAIAHYRAEAGGGVVLDIATGEVLGMVSLPDYNPNQPLEAQQKNAGNRMTGGVFELGSVVKAVTFAMALDLGVCTLESRYDARFPLIVGHSRISDFHPEGRILTVPEIFMVSSNIATAKMALDVGIEGHQAFLRKVGLFDRMQTELPEAAAPLLPPRWSTITTVTAAFGHGFAVQPLQGAAVAAALLNGGRLMTPTFLKRDREAAEAVAVRIVKPETSRKLRDLFRLNVEKGTASKADVPGLRVGGKTGTAEKVINGRYSKNHRLNSFVGAFPMDDPRYLVLLMLDEPQAVRESMGFATAGWNAVPAAATLIARIAPLLGVEPVLTADERDKLEKAAAAGKTASRAVH
jgi:cell division protein FtsI (penicillin-binding protein 3)